MKLTASLPLKIGLNRPQKENSSSNFKPTIEFQGRWLLVGEGTTNSQICIQFPRRFVFDIMNAYMKNPDIKNPCSIHKFADTFPGDFPSLRAA